MQIKKFVIFILLYIIPFALQSQSVGVVFSGGGAKGLSHIGALIALEENGIPVDFIAGTSMGAIVGGLYAIGLTPEEMLTLFRSKEFESWYSGQQEPYFATYMYRKEASSEMFGVTLSKDKKSKISINLPTSIVSPYPMDLAVVQIFASPSAAAGYNFNKLMVPFRCVSADVANKKSVVLRKGDLGSAIRSSMTFPFFFKPIMIDSVLLFDGGFYNNFPWDVMVQDFNPDYIIGVKCATQFSRAPTSDDIISQIESMLTAETNYNIPEERGILIDSKFEDVSLLDFGKIDDIVAEGYRNTMKLMPEIKERIKRRIKAEELLNRRLEFRRRCLPLVFEKVVITDSLVNEQKEFIDKTFREDRTRYFDFEQLKRGYYRVIASGNVKDFFPVAKMKRDSIFDIHLRVSTSPPLRLSIGGNISSSSLNQGYVGAEYHKFSVTPWRVHADLNLGRFYSGLSGYFRQDFSVRPLAFYEVQFTSHRFDYFGGNQTNFFSNNTPSSNVQESEIFGKVSIATPVNIYQNILAKLSFAFGRNIYQYFQNERFTSYDVPDITYYSFFSPSLMIERNTTNYPIYPTEGMNGRVSLRFTGLSEDYKPGSTSLGKAPIENMPHTSLSFRYFTESFEKISDLLILGWSADVVISNPLAMKDRISTLMIMPAFEPFPHSRTLLQNTNRAPSFLGVSVTPILKIYKSIFFHFKGVYFQPYRQLRITDDGSTRFSDNFPRGTFMADVAAVWQSPVGPVSLSAS
ncbi:MAG: patatin-like phospholipase family protein, partial [Bacteroidales bacterium]|nr:patatin-like phospholipase family protein [Bacteroidales bacterium]